MLTTAKEVDSKTAIERSQSGERSCGKTQSMAKKVFIGMTVLLLALGLAACSGEPSKSQQTDAGADWNSVVSANPDDPYVKSYESEANSLMTTHKDLGYTCEDCHDKSAANVIGSVQTIPDSSESSVGTRELCLSCHDFSSIKDSTILPGDVTVYNPEGVYNVHDNHRGDENCGSCHSMHETSTLYCVYCHYMEVPTGWDGFE